MAATMCPEFLAQAQGFRALSWTKACSAHRGDLSGFCPNGSATHLIARGAGSRESRDTA